MSFFNIGIFFLQFLLWTLLVYLMHRLAHWRSKYNFLYQIHLTHHKVDYLNPVNRSFKWFYLLFYFGGLYETLDVILILTLPALIVYFINPNTGIYLLVFHYMYEVFLSEGFLDHNPNVTGSITRYLSWGKYHLGHHRNWKKNYSLMITLWDYIFGTRK